MTQTILNDGTPIFCLRKPETKMLDHHVEGYLQNGIAIDENDVVFDVGANVGVFGLRAIQKAKNVRAYCFEPIPDIFSVLKKNAEVHGQGRIHTFQLGISDTSEKAMFTYFPNTPALSTLHPEEWDKDPKAFSRAVKGTMKNPPDGMKWMKLIPPIFSGLIAKFLVKGKKLVECNLVTLSSIIEKEQVEKIDLLKIDCEGAEWSVLKGISDEHWPKIKSVVVEVHDIDHRLEKIKKMLNEKGFSRLHHEREIGLEDSVMFNLFALR
ncbi:MAG: FkbM family methyltransferase [Crocinitomicaceae bacterium]|jgi:FkbM family methyltransferase|tara:strand:- start:52143 stop:52940 length:798 start_codon:yes stop_codon:yes gene_type:complete